MGMGIQHLKGISVPIISNPTSNHVTEKMAENNKAKMLWDFTLLTDYVIEAERPDILVLHKQIHG